MNILDFCKCYEKHEGYYEGQLDKLILSVWVDELFLSKFPSSMSVEVGKSNGYHAVIGKTFDMVPLERAESYSIAVSRDGINLVAKDKNGLCYGLLALSMLISKGCPQCCLIKDWPAVQNRGLMLDASRGKVYTVEQIKKVVDVLALSRYNIFQLYIEHTFAFSRYPEISEGCDAYTKEDILEIKEYCKKKCIRLQGNLQSFGHCRRILTRKEHMELRESGDFWTLSPVEEGTYTLLENMYAEYMPLFDDVYFNVCSDETYDLGQGKSNEISKKTSIGEVYKKHLLRLRELAAQNGKKLMAFGDIVLKHPDLISDFPDDVIFLDWIYDPKNHYNTPSVFNTTGRRFWVCPGTGQWNSLFPRFDGTLINIEGLVLEGLKNNADGMLLTDWNDHGGYAMAGFALYSYVFAGLVSWSGSTFGRNGADDIVDWIIDEPSYSTLMHLYAEIYMLPPIWSKNRSECVMALFDEPVYGSAIRGELPSPGIKAYDLELPPGIQHVLEPMAHHPLRPYFSIPEDTISEICKIVHSVEPIIEKMRKEELEKQFRYVHDAFLLLADKLRFSRDLVAKMNTRHMTSEDFILYENKVSDIIKRFCRLEMDFISIWRMMARDSEIEISLTYFSNIIGRFDYLRTWLEKQRCDLEKNYVPDYDFSTYETAGYNTIPTY